MVLSKKMTQLSLFVLVLNLLDDFFLITIVCAANQSVPPEAASKHAYFVWQDGFDLDDVHREKRQARRFLAGLPLDAAPFNSSTAIARRTSFARLRNQAAGQRDLIVGRIPGNSATGGGNVSNNHTDGLLRLKLISGGSNVPVPRPVIPEAETRPTTILAATIPNSTMATTTATSNSTTALTTRPSLTSTTLTTTNPAPPALPTVKLVVKNGTIAILPNGTLFRDSVNFQYFDDELEYDLAAIERQINQPRTASLPTADDIVPDSANRIDVSSGATTVTSAHQLENSTTISAAIITTTSPKTTDRETTQQTTVGSLRSGLFPIASTVTVNPTNAPSTDPQSSLPPTVSYNLNQAALTTSKNIQPPISPLGQTITAVPVQQVNGGILQQPVASKTIGGSRLPLVNVADTPPLNRSAYDSLANSLRPPENNLNSLADYAKLLLGSSDKPLSDPATLANLASNAFSRFLPNDFSSKLSPKLLSPNLLDDRKPPGPSSTSTSGPDKGNFEVLSPSVISIYDRPNALIKLPDVFKNYPDLYNLTAKVLLDIASNQRYESLLRAKNLTTLPEPPGAPQPKPVPGESNFESGARNFVDENNNAILLPRHDDAAKSSHLNEMLNEAKRKIHWLRFQPENITDKESAEIAEFHRQWRSNGTLQREWRKWYKENKNLTEEQLDILMALNSSRPFDEVLRDALINKPYLIDPAGASSPTILSPLIESPYILSPYIFGPFILSPSVLNPQVLSPSILAPSIISPYVLSPLILSPQALDPSILSPYVLSPYILSPGILSPSILSPTVLNPCILSPYALGPVVLSPGVLSPSVLCPSVLPNLDEEPAVLSPCGLC